jgi:tight adherence protein C
METVLALVLASVAAVCGASAVVLRADPLPLVTEDADESGGRDVGARSPLARLEARLGSIGVLGRVGGAPQLDARLRQAGDATPTAEVVGARFLLAAVCFVGCLLLAPFRALAPFAALAGFAVPGLRLTRAVRARRASADRELPLLLDLLAAASAAGLSGQLALRRALEATHGPLAEELSAAMRRVDLGGRWRDELEATADRLELPDLRRAVAVLTRSDTIGSSLADALGELARESRDARRTLVAERARKAPVKMLFPLVFLVLPAFLLLTVVPVLVTTLGSIR